MATSLISDRGMTNQTVGVEVYCTKSYVAMGTNCHVRIISKCEETYRPFFGKSYELDHFKYINYLLMTEQM